MRTYNNNDSRKANKNSDKAENKPILVGVGNRTDTLPPGEYEAVVRGYEIIKGKSFQRLQAEYELKDGRIYTTSFPLDDEGDLYQWCPWLDSFRNYLTINKNGQFDVSESVGWECVFNVSTKTGSDGRRHCNITEFWWLVDDEDKVIVNDDNADDDNADDTNDDDTNDDDGENDDMSEFFEND